MRKRSKPKVKKNRPHQKRKQTAVSATFADLLERGTRGLQRGQLQQATANLQQAYQLEPTSLDAALNLGGVYILTKKFAQAVAILEPLAQAHAHNAMVWTNLGAAYLGNPILAKDEDQQRAIAAFEKALAIDPIAPNVAYNIGLIYRDRRDMPQAMHWFEKAVQANPADKDARGYLEQLRGK